MRTRKRTLRDQVLAPASGSTMIDACGVTDLREIDTDHSPFCRRPDHLTEILIELPTDKNRPTQERIAGLRKRFPTEREIDRSLTRKMRRRAGPGYTQLPLETLVAGVQRLLEAELTHSFTISDAKWMSGGASKLQVAFRLDWEKPGVGDAQTPMVLRMEPAESIVETSRLREFQLIRALQGVLPVPTAYWCDPDGSYLPYPALICGFAAGVTKPSDATSGVSGLGTRLPQRIRPLLASQFVDHLAALHTADVRSMQLDAFDVPETGTTQCAQWGVNWWERVWEEDSDEDVPLMRLAAAWLRTNMPVLDRPVIVHGDYRVGNFLFTEHDTTITAWLDWELSRIGDRHQDIAWATSRAFSCLAEDGKALLASGLMPEAEFISEYEQRSGLEVDPTAVHWYKVYNAYMLVTVSLATGYRVAANGKTHQDVLVAWLMGVSSMLLDEIRGLIQRGA